MPPRGRSLKWVIDLPPIVLLDACVLYPAALRDLLMRLAVHDLIQVKWSEKIHEEWMTAVLRERPDLTRVQLARTRQLMDLHAGKKSDLAELARVLTERLQTRYALPVSVSEPVKVGGKVSTWKLTIETRPDQKHLPAQRIHLDICAIPSYDPRPMMLRNLYGIDLGTSGLILQAQSREEILADKIIALAFRENRIKNRDLWDIAWLTQQGIELPTQLIPIKIRDHQRENAEFVTLLTERTAALQTQAIMREDFMKEMRRFLPAATVRDTIEKEAYWSYLADLVEDLGKKAMAALR